MIKLIHFSDFPKLHSKEQIYSGFGKNNRTVVSSIIPPHSNQQSKMAAPSSPTLPVSGSSTTTSNITKINVGTRRSQLAIAQVDSIIKQLKALHLASPDIDYVTHVVSTMADENQVKSFSAFDSKSIWTEELEALLAKGELDVVVHCLKGSFFVLCPPSQTRLLSTTTHPTRSKSIHR